MATLAENLKMGTDKFLGQFFALADFKLIWDNIGGGVSDFCKFLAFLEKPSTCWNTTAEKEMRMGIYHCHIMDGSRGGRNFRKYNIKKNDQRRILKQHHYLAWSSHGFPPQEDDILKFLISVKGKVNSKGEQIVVHDRIISHPKILIIAQVNIMCIAKIILKFIQNMKNYHDISFDINTHYIYTSLISKCI
ncbi:unnamed protein product, partial [Meganyctiphanes norvegica]